MDDFSSLGSFKGIRMNDTSNLKGKDERKLAQGKMGMERITKIAC